MRILLIHSDFIKFEAKKKAIQNADEIKEGIGNAENALVVFVAVEKIDEQNPDSVIKKLAEDVRDTIKKVGAESVVIYPYAHLSSSLGSPESARRILNSVYDDLKSEFKTLKAPFGWYKSFEIKCKGHPLSELSRTILPEDAEKEKESVALKAEKRLKSEWFVLDLDGKLIPVNGFNFDNYQNLKKFVDYEISKVRAVEKEPPHVKFMKTHEIADYEPGSDPGNMRWYPKGSLIKRLLEEHVSSIVVKNGGMQVETPIMYDLNHPQLSKYLNRFPARQYTLKSGDKEYFLRFAACFGQYLMSHDMTISYKNLPLKLYELSHYSFRHEQSGELVGLRRLRAFTMPDMHTLVRDIETAKEEFLEQYKLCMGWMNDLNLNYEIGIRFIKDFYEKNKEFANELVKLAGRPALIEVWDEMPFYFVMKFEFNIVDALDKASALSTVQIDIENTERFDINYTDENGEKKHPLMLHASISGSIDRNVYALLEKAYLDQQNGKKAILPLWLSPTQVRIIPLSGNFLSFAEDIALKIENEKIRVDIDDRNESMGKKIMESEKEWIPFIIVVGGKEKESGLFSVRIRETGKQEEMELEKIIADVKEKISKFPFKPLPMPKLISKRARFVG